MPRDAQQCQTAIPFPPLLPARRALPLPQTFQNDVLQLCGRAHDAADVYRAIEAVHAVGVPSWSLDLMSGLPQVRAQAPLLPLILLAAVPTALPLPHSPPCDLQ